MKTTFLSILFLFATVSLAAPKPDDYPITVHVSSSQQTSISGYSGTLQSLNVTISGKKYLLVSPFGPGLLALGDYKAKLIKDEHRTTYESNQTYRFLLPDDKTRDFRVIGQSE